MEKAKAILRSIIGDLFIYHINTESWGIEVLIMGKNWNCFARIYWFNDDAESVYLNWLSVSTEVRKQGIATLLQELREDIGRKLGYKLAYLQVEDGSWMHEWYKRRGYVDCENSAKEENLIWMHKQL